MTRTLSHPITALIALLLLGATSAHAAATRYTFSGALDSGVFNGETYSGQFSFDDATLTGLGEEYLSVDNLTLSFHSQTYTQINAAAVPEAAFADGAFLGLSFIVKSSDPTFSLVPGFSSIADAYVAYDASAGASGYGSVAYTPVPVPEPETYALLLAGLGLVGWTARRAHAPAGEAA